MKKILIASAVLMMTAPLTMAGTVNSANVTTFESGSAARAADVNATIAALVAAINDNAERLAALEQATPDNTVAGNSYQLLSINSSVAVGGQPGEGSFNEHGFANVSNGSLKATISFGEGGTASLSIAAGDDAEYEINMPNNSLQNYADNPAENETLSYVQNGNSVVVTFPEDGTTFDVEFLVSADGSLLTSATKEYEANATFDDGSSGEFAFVELIVGTRSGN
ncbi:hypothetical protein [Spongiibacter sp.]|uniref:hypothetical protein n=1 Tax=Spongiibacter sp. TaxID=2024860 RepID=UPI003567113D